MNTSSSKFNYNGKSHNTLENEAFAKTVTAAEMRYYLKHVKSTGMNYPGPVASTMERNKIDFLDKKTLGDVLYILALANTSSTTIMVSPFNCNAILKAKGFGLAFHPTIDDNTDLGDTIMKTTTGIEFPRNNSSGYLRFFNPVTSFYCPVQGSFINTNFFKVNGIQKFVFDVQIAEICAMLATFFGMRNGVVKFVSAGEAGAKLFKFDVVMAESFNVNALWIEDFLKEIIWAIPSPESRGWTYANLNGLAFAHTLYHAIAVGLTSVRGKSGEMIEKIMLTCNSLVADRHDRKFVDVVNDVLVIAKPAIVFPADLCDKALNLMEKKAALDQASVALLHGRSFRGQDKGQKSDLTRIAYTGITMDPSIAETVYLATNLTRVVSQFEDIILVTGEKNAIGTMAMLLNVLQMVSFKGKIFMQEVPSFNNLLVPTGKGDHTWTYGDADFTVVTCATAIDFAIRTNRIYQSYKVTPSERSVIIDLRQAYYPEYTKNTFEAFDKAVSDAFLSYFDQWQGWSYAVFARTRLFNGLILKEWAGVQVVSGVEIHNLVVWTCFKFALSKDEWWYVIDSIKIFEEYCAASIVCNITRSLRYFYGMNPNFVLRQLKYRVPKITLSSLAKRSVLTTAWQDTKIQEALSHGSARVQELFASASGDMQAMMLATPAIKSMLSQDNPSVVTMTRVNSPIMNLFEDIDEGIGDVYD